MAIDFRRLDHTRIPVGGDERSGRLRLVPSVALHLTGSPAGGGTSSAP
jgi:hypothetical protein